MDEILKGKGQKVRGKRERGITLIALVITVIVLLILAGVTIATLTGDNGILSNATKAEEETRASEVEERVNLWKTEKETSNYTNTIVKNDSELLEEMKEAGILFEEEIDRENKIITIGERVINYGIEGSLTDIYVALYNDGTLVFSNKNNFDESKIVKNGNFGNIKDKDYDLVWIEEEPYIDLEKAPPWFKLMIEGTNISKVEFISEIFPNDNNIGNIFRGLMISEIKKIENLNTSNVTNMSNMFSETTITTDVDLSKLDVSNVTDMSGMFSYSHIKNIDLSGWDMSNVTDMAEMFANSEVTSVNLSNTNTSSVEDMSLMFYACTSLTSVNLEGIDTSKVINMSNMFAYCKQLTTLDISQIKTSKVTDMSYMFLKCTSLINLDVSNFDVTNMISNPNEVLNMFYGITVPITISSTWTEDMKKQTGYKGEGFIVK